MKRLAIALVVMIVMGLVFICGVGCEIGRPNFGPRQVKTLTEIHKGDYFIKIFQDRTSLDYDVINVIREPYWRCFENFGRGETCSWAIDILHVKSDGTPRERRYFLPTPRISPPNPEPKLYYDQIYLSEVGVISDRDRSWSKFTALLKIDKSELTPSVIEKIMIEEDALLRNKINK